MTVQTDDIIRVTARMTHASISAVQNQFHFRWNGGSPEDDFEVENAIALLLDDAYAYLVAFQQDNFAYDDILVWNVSQDRPMQTQAWPTLTAGSESEPMLPLQLAALVLFRTNTARSQGRKYLPPSIGSTSTGGGFLSSTYLAAAASWANEITATVSTPNGVLNAGNWRYPVGPFSEWLTGSVGTLFRTQRRRVFGIGI